MTSWAKSVGQKPVKPTSNGCQWGLGLFIFCGMASFLQCFTKKEKKESTTFSIDSPSTTKRYYPKFSDVEWFIAKHCNQLLEFEFAVLLWHLLCWFKRIIKRHIQNGFPVCVEFMFPVPHLKIETERGIKLDHNWKGELLRNYPQFGWFIIPCCWSSWSRGESVK